MKLQTRWRAAVVAAALAAAALPALAAADDNMPGDPPSSCPGTLLSKYTDRVTRGSDTLTMYLYYSPANGGTNCAIARKSGAWYGRSNHISIHLWKGIGYPSDTTRYDVGHYKSYAGAVYVTGTDGMCVSAMAGAAKWGWRDGPIQIGVACG